MSFVDDLGGEGALKTALDKMYGRMGDDENLRELIDLAAVKSLQAEQVNCLSLFIEGETDDAAAVMPAAHAFMMNKQFDDNAFDAMYDHYHNTLAEFGVPGGMVHGFLDSFEDLRILVVT